MPSFYIPLSGLNADSTALNTIANNLSNMNTTGFKSQTTNFSDLFYQQTGTTGSGDEIQQGSGVQVSSNSTDFTGGSITSTGIATDAAINGTGFFVLNNNGSQLYSRDGNFQLSSAGTLESTQGQAVMGYGVTNGVVNTSGALTDITVPTGQVMQPAATTSFSLAQNLDSTTAVGSQTTGNVQIYDSLGKAYEATVTYTNLGDNKWSYAVTVPDTLAAAAATAASAQLLPVTATTASAATVTGTLTAVTSTPSVGNTAYTYSFGSSGGILPSSDTSGAQATVDTSTNLVITGATATSTASITAPAITAGESVSTYATALQSAITAAGITGVTATATGGQLVITGATATTSVAGNVAQDLQGATVNYNLGSSATVDPSTNLAITGLTAAGTSATITLPTVTAGESLSSYATALSGALTTAGITNVSVTANADGQLSITGANLTTTGGVNQNLTASTISYNFGSSSTALATVNPGTDLTISGLTASGVNATTTAPTVTSGETVAQYAAALNQSLVTAGITGVAATVSGGKLSISGANMSTGGSLVQDPPGLGQHHRDAELRRERESFEPQHESDQHHLQRTFGLGRAPGSDLESLWHERDWRDHPDRCNQRAIGASAERLRERQLSELRHRLGRHRNGNLLEWAEPDRGAVGAGDGEQHAGVERCGLDRISDHGRLRPGHGGRGWNGRARRTGRRVPGGLECQYLLGVSDLIVAQRAFEANSKAMTTFDTLTQETINMIH